MALDDFLSPRSFDLPDHLDPSGWVEHIPFAFWLMEQAAPATFVELGTHTGTSYLAFCQAVQANGLPTRCTAVDSWVGDDHAGFYGEEVLRALSARHARYEGFSRLFRARFDEALPSFADGSIDLLHIDGRHGYEDARHDFETWAPKLSGRGIVLFHDIEVRDRGFGVYRLWAELAGENSFAFLHGHGLGVLGLGRALPPAIRRFFEIGRDPAQARLIRDAYGRLGGSLSDRLRVEPGPRNPFWRNSLGRNPLGRLAGIYRAITS